MMKLPSLKLPPIDKARLLGMLKRKPAEAVAAPSIPALNVAFCGGCKWAEECCEAGECLIDMRVKP